MRYYPGNPNATLNLKYEYYGLLFHLEILKLLDTYVAVSLSVDLVIHTSFSFLTVKWAKFPVVCEPLILSEI